MPGVEAFTSIASAYAKSGQPDEATRWIGSMKKARVRPNLLSYTSAIMACSRSQPVRVDLADILFRDMSSTNIAPDNVLFGVMTRIFGGGRRAPHHALRRPRML